jgi:outer membrane lipoprotein SlyB
MPAKAPAEQAAATAPVAALPAVAPVCTSCGVITDIREVKTEGKGSGVGIVAGGLAGIVVGNQIGGGNGKTLAKIAGAAGGAYLGNRIEKKVRATTSFEVSIKLDDGSSTMITLDHKPSLGVGAAVRIANGDVIARDERQ